MPTLIRISGPYGYILSLLALVVLVLTLRTMLLLLRKAAPPAAELRDRLSAILFWGFVSAALGFLGQCTGSYMALTEILGATEISPSVVAEGFVTSFVPTLFGLGILFFAALASSALRLLAGGRIPAPQQVGSTFFVLVLLLGCGGEGGADAQQGSPETLAEGVWILEAPPDLFLWEFSRGEEGWACLVHDLRGGMKLNETPCRSVAEEGGRVTVAMDTGVRLEVSPNLAKARLEGRLSYPDGGGMKVTLPWAPRDRYPALRARAEEGPYAYRPPRDRGDGWAVAAAGDAAMDPEALEAMVQAADRGDMGVLHSLLVARHGRLVLEEYFHGYGPEELHHLASCTKSISSLLVGLAIQEGAVSGTDARVTDFFPGEEGSLGEGWENLTLEHLLTMTMALDWSPEEAENLHGTGPDFFRGVLSHSVSGAPGRDWAYVSANVNLIAGILHQATGEHAEAFARRTLFEPLGIRAWEWNGMRTAGYNLMDGSLRLLPRDMAKIGQLVLEEGRWQGREVMESEWIRASTRPRVRVGDGAEGYGYLWWTMEAPGPDRSPVPAVFANGWGSQFIVIFPTLDLVVVTTGGNEFNGKHMAVAGVLGRVLLPGVRTSAP